MELTNIKRGNGTTNKNGEGLKTYVLVCLAEIYGRSADTEVKVGNLISTIEIGGTTRFAKYEGVTVKFKTTSNGDDDAKHYNTEGEIFIPAITAAKSAELGALVNHPCVIIVEDRNNNLRKMGELHDGVNCDIEEVTEGKNGVLLKFKISGQPTPPDFVASLAGIPIEAD